MDLIYSFNILSLAGALPLLSVFIHLFISAEVIFEFKMWSAFSMLMMGLSSSASCDWFIVLK